MLVGSHCPWSHNARHQRCLKNHPCNPSLTGEWLPLVSELQTTRPAGIYQATNEHFVVRADVLQAGGKKGDLHTDLSEFDQGHIEKARWFSTKLQPLWVFPVCSGQCLSKVVQGRDVGELATPSGRGQQWLIDAHKDQSLAQVICFNRQATVAQTVRKANTANNRKVPGYTCNLLGLGLRSCRLVRGSWWILSTAKGSNNRHVSIRSD